MIDEILRLGLKCNFNCLFCNVFNHEKSPERDFEGAKRELNRLHEKNKDALISISGGEPLLYSYLPKLIEYGVSKGIKMNLQTNASLVTREKAKELANAGLRMAFVNFPSHIPSVYAKLTRTSAKTFEKAVQGIKSLIDNGIEVTINLVINEWNYREIPGYLEFVSENFPEVKEVNFSVIQPHGNARINSYLVPDYRKIKSFIEKGIEKAKELGIAIENPFCGLPLCFVPENANLLKNSELAEGYEARKSFKIPEPLKRVISSKVQSENCFDCYLKNFCLGVWKAYREIRGDIVEPKHRVFKFWPTSEDIAYWKRL